MPWDRFFDRYVSSHVGSLPLEHSSENVRTAFRDLVEVGIDVPPVPQLRDFVSMYLQPLVDAGVVEPSGVAFSSSPGRLEGAPGVRPRVAELELAAELAKLYRVARVRVPVTGPFTLASKVYVGDPSRGVRSTALASRELVVDVLSNYVSKVVATAAEVPGALVVVDEPVLGTIVGARVMLFGYSEDDVLEAYSRALKPARPLRGTHVCGQLNERLVSILVESESLDFLNHEFYDAPTNLSLPWRKLLERGDKFLSPGVFSSKRPVVESLEEVREFAERLLKGVGGERVNLFSGDCGLGGLRGISNAYEVALGKLKSLVEAVEALNKR